MKILIACEFSGRIRDAYRKLGYEAWSCDIDKPNPSPFNEFHIQSDVLEILELGWDLMIAHPPCTYLTIAGNRWYTKDDPRKIDALSFVMKLAKASISRIAIENPPGSITKHWKSPSQVIHPYQFGHNEKKRTCLWLKNLPKLVPTKIVEPKKESEITRYSGHYANRAKVRSLTYLGIAEAIANQWNPETLNEQSTN